MTDLPEMRLTVDGNKYKATPENCSLFTFVNESRDHVFLATEVATEEEKHTRQVGAYLFRIVVDQEVFEEMAEYMLENDYPMHLNQRQVAQCDEDAYQMCVGQLVEREITTIPDEIPVEWENGS